MAAMLKNHESLDLADLLGPEWEGFRLTHQGLHHPYWRRPFTRAELVAMFYRVQQVACLEHELKRARAEAEKATAAQEAAETRADYYRRHLTLESRAGAMLARLFSRA